MEASAWETTRDAAAQLPHSLFDKTPRHRFGPASETAGHVRRGHGSPHRRCGPPYAYSNGSSACARVSEARSERSSKPTASGHDPFQTPACVMWRRWRRTSSHRSGRNSDATRSSRLSILETSHHGGTIMSSVFFLTQRVCSLEALVGHCSGFLGRVSSGVTRCNSDSD